MQRYITDCLREKIRQHNAKQEDIKRFLVELNKRVQDRLNQLMLEEMQLKSILRMQSVDAEQESANMSQPEEPNSSVDAPVHEDLVLTIHDWHHDFGFSPNEEEEEEDDDEETAEGSMQTQLDCASDDEHLDSFPPNIRTEALQMMHQLIKRHDERMNQSADLSDEDAEVTSPAFHTLSSSDMDSSEQDEMGDQNTVLLKTQQTSKSEANSTSEVDADKENESL